MERMTRLAAVLSLLGFFVLTACNLQTSDSASSPHSVDTEHMQIATANGFEIIARSSVISLDVRLYASSEHDIFYDSNAMAKLAPISLNTPEIVGGGGGEGQTTGEMTLAYRRGSLTESKLLYIKQGSNGQYVEDVGMQKSIRYRTSVPLDSSWIRG